MKIRYASWLMLMLLAAVPAAPAPLSLSDVENAALEYSPRFRGAVSERKAYEERASVQRSFLYPRLTLDGTYRYVTEVQEIAVPLPGSPRIKIGDNYSYSVGPLLNWTAWDFGGIRNTARSASAAAEAKKNESEAVRRQVLLSARSAYFQVALADEQVKLYADALKLANAQYDDIRINVKAGTRSLADELKAHQEVIARKKQLRQAQADKAAALRELSAVTGQKYEGIALESVDSMIKTFEPYSKAALNEGHPALTALWKSAAAADYSKQAAGAARWPRVQLSARSSVDYPNGTVLESFNQNAFSASLSMPLFESGASGSRIRENENAKQASLRRGEQTLADLRREWDTTMNQLSNLRDQKELNDISVSETEQLGRILYRAYEAGSISYLEVENANFKALEAKIQAARTDVQILMNLAVLAGMAE